MDYGDMYLNKNNEGKKDKKGFSYWIGYTFATVCSVCLMVVIVAATYKFLLWLY